MGKEPGSPQDEGTPPPGEAPPPFNPDPDIVTFLERGTKPDPKEVWKATQPKRRN